jgi:hypothetical protein
MLVDTQSPFQHIQIFDSETYGRVLVLDGAIQVRFRACSFSSVCVWFLVVVGMLSCELQVRFRTLYFF